MCVTEAFDALSWKPNNNIDPQKRQSYWEPLYHLHGILKYFFRLRCEQSVGFCFYWPGKTLTNEYREFFWCFFTRSNSGLLYHEEVRVHTSSSCVLSSLPLLLCFMLRRLILCTVIFSYLVEHVLYQEALQRRTSLSLGAPLENLLEGGSYTGNFGR